MYVVLQKTMNPRSPKIAFSSWTPNSAKSMVSRQPYQSSIARLQIANEFDAYRPPLTTHRLGQSDQIYVGAPVKSWSDLSCRYCWRAIIPPHICWGRFRICKTLASLLLCLAPPRYSTLLWLNRKGLCRRNIMFDRLEALVVVRLAAVRALPSIICRLCLHDIFHEEFFGFPLVFALLFEHVGFGAELLAFLLGPLELAAQQLEELGCGQRELTVCEGYVGRELHHGGRVRDREVLEVDDVVVRIVDVGGGWYRDARGGM
jgi:hypothetical protein